MQTDQCVQKSALFDTKFASEDPSCIWYLKKNTRLKKFKRKLKNSSIHLLTKNCHSGLQVHVASTQMQIPSLGQFMFSEEQSTAWLFGTNANKIAKIRKNLKNFILKIFEIALNFSWLYFYTFQSILKISQSCFSLRVFATYNMFSRLYKFEKKSFFLKPYVLLSFHI